MNTGTNYADTFYSNTVNDIDTLEKNVKEYPVSSVARFLLLYNYKKNNDPAFEKLAKQTGIYFNNPFWIQYQLSQVGEEKKEVAESFENNQPINSFIYQEEPFTVNTQITQNPTSDTYNNDEGKNEVTEPFEHDQPITTLPENQEEPFTVNEEITQNPDSDIYNNDEGKNEITESFEHDQPITTLPDNQEEPFTANQEIAQNPTSDIYNNDEGKNEFSSNEFSLQNPSESETKIMENPELIISKDEEEFPAFEPLHTVDYFASQGIKLTEEALENDHLGQQVKSFTAWLKSMKKLHPGQIPEQNEVIEKIIQSSAEVSNQNANVLTEAMAEVLIKQNKKEKAIEMYQKLSLINPSKSAYFAAKIESLKII